jgi:hypothetical protein
MEERILQFWKEVYQEPRDEIGLMKNMTLSWVDEDASDLEPYDAHAN